MNESKLKKDLFELIQVMHALASEHNLEKLLKLIVTSAVDITHSDAASLYLKDNNRLKFVVTTNKTLEARWGKQKFELQFKPYHIAITKESISGYVAVTGEIVNIPDVSSISGQPYTFNKSFSEKNDYPTISLLTIPLINRQTEIIGVLQLLNKIADDGSFTTFDKYDEEVAISMGAQAAVALDNVRLNESLRKAHYDTLLLLSAANEFRDNETGHHVKRVSAYCGMLAEAMGLDSDFIQNITFASPLHDIGKIGIPDGILLKPGKLTDEEYTIMKNHTTIGAQILKDADTSVLTLAKELALSHHEKWDGSGYPAGLKNDDIPLSGRITAIADVFDALSNKRVYKPAFTMEQTFGIIKESTGTHFDPEIAKVFLKQEKEILRIFKAYQDKDG